MAKELEPRERPMDDKGMAELRAAVVLQAVKDYKAYGKRVNRKPKDDYYALKFLQCEWFFESKYFSFFTNLDNKHVLKRLKDEVRMRTAVREFISRLKTKGWLFK